VISIRRHVLCSGEEKVNRSSIKLSLLIFAAIAVVPAAFGQNWPRPAKTQNTPVVCPASSPACAGKEGKWTAPYSDPIKTFVGRYLDSQATGEHQDGFRTARARLCGIDQAHNRLYMIVGSALFAYDLQNFINRLNAGAAMVLAVPAGTNHRGLYPETYLPPDAMFYAERSNWQIFNTDGQDRLFGFDWDDRGYVYVAYNPYGWGIIKDNGGLDSVWQQPTGPSDVTPNRVLSVRRSDGYYLIISPDGGSSSNVYYVGSSANDVVHERRTNISHVITAFAKASNDFIATVEADGRLHVYTNDGIVTGAQLLNIGAPEGSFYSVDTDGTNFYAMSQGTLGTANARLTILTPSGNSYAAQPAIDLGRTYGSYPTARYGAGYLLVFGSEGYTPGTDAAAARNLRLYRVVGTSITPIPVLVGAAQPEGSTSRQYFANYYMSDAAHDTANQIFYTAPLSSGLDGSSNPPGDARIFKLGGKFYLIAAAVGLGDVYELAGGESVSAKVKKIGRNANSKAAGVAGPGPFYGDEITFTSTSTSATPPAVTWTFSGDTNGYPHAPSVPDIAYQFGGLTAASLANGPVTKSATVAVDTSTSDTVSVQIQGPQVRMGISGHPELLFTQPDISSSAPIVSSDQWVDASDGALESHFTDWNIDGTASTKVPDQTVGVGSCGTHTLIFTAHYGPNNPLNFAMLSSEATYSINPFKYNVQPYTISVSDPIKDPNNAANILFAAILRTANNSDLPAGGGTAATYTWTLLNADGSPAGVTQTGTSTLASPTTFSVPKSTFGSAVKQVRLQVDIAPSATPCTAFATQSRTKSNLSGPTGSITINPTGGCLNLGSPCSFSFGTPNAAWHYTWTATGAGQVIGSSGDGAAYATYTPNFPLAGAYTINVTVENAIGIFNAAPVGISLALPVCSSNPDAGNTAIAYYGAANGSGCQGSSDTCKTGETITIYAQQFGWTKQSCDVYDWDFGDGSQHSTDATATHVYNSPSTYTITMKLKGGLGPQLTLTKTITIGNGTQAPPPPPPPPPSGGCGTITATSVYLGYGGADSGCTPNFGNCNANEGVSFAVYGQNGYSLSCAAHNYSWNFGDPASPLNASNEANPSHTFATSGTYTVSLTISNQTSLTTVTVPVKVGNGAPPPPPVCGAMTASNVSPSYSSATVPTCHEGGGNCSAGEPIAFQVGLSGYGCSITTYSWNFGSGGASSNSATPTFTYPSAGDYSGSVTVSNATTPNPVTVPFSVHVTPAQVGACPEMTKQNLYFGWYGADSACVPNNGDCKDTELVGFSVYRNGYSFSCATHTFTWDFDDGSPNEQGQFVQHKFRNAGIFDVTLTITNTAGGSLTLTEKVRVANASGQTPVPPPPRKRSARH
jgi:PKD repeat protein